MQKYYNPKHNFPRRRMPTRTQELYQKTQYLSDEDSIIIQQKHEYKYKINRD